VAKCIQCGSETQMYVDEVPLCIACDEAREHEALNQNRADPANEEADPRRTRGCLSVRGQ